MSRKNYNDEKARNLLISKIFHDVGNCVSLLNFLVEVNKDDPKSFDFNELVEINNRILVNLRVLQYLFLPKSAGPTALEDIKKYLEHKGKKVNFHFDAMFLTEERFVLMVHSLLMLSRLLIDPATIDIDATNAELKFSVVSKVPLSSERLKLFDSIASTATEEINISDDLKTHLCYVETLLAKLALNIDTNLSSKEFVLRLFVSQ